MKYFDGLKMTPEFLAKVNSGKQWLKDEWPTEQEFISSVNTVTEDMKKNPTKYVPMGTAASVRGGMLDDAYLASRRAIDAMTPMQLQQRTVTNLPKPINYINQYIENTIKPAINLNRELGNMEEVSRLARQWAQLVRQRASL